MLLRLGENCEKRLLRGMMLRRDIRDKNKYGLVTRSPRTTLEISTCYAVVTFSSFPGARLIDTRLVDC